MSAEPDERGGGRDDARRGDAAARRSDFGPGGAGGAAARVLILGGTTEARLLAASLARRPGVAAVLSLAGRTADPVTMPVPVRSGGFGGVDGLAGYLRDEAVDVLVDATHPFATRISVHASATATRAGVPLVALRRPPWRAVAGDRWREVDDVDGAVDVLQGRPRRVFLALGRQELAPFVRAPQHAYLIRSVDPVEPPLAVPDATYLTARGPFDEAADRALLEAFRIDAVVAKNSGGDATYGKIAAARALGVEVVLVRRPPALADTVSTVEAALEAIGHHLASRSAASAAGSAGAAARGE